VSLAEALEDAIHGQIKEGNGLRGRLWWPKLNARTTSSKYSQDLVWACAGLGVARVLRRAEGMEKMSNERRWGRLTS